MDLERLHEVQADQLALLISRGNTPQDAGRKLRFNRKHVKKLLGILRDRAEMPAVDPHTAFAAYTAHTSPSVQRLKKLLDTTDRLEAVDPEFDTEVTDTEESYEESGDGTRPIKRVRKTVKAAYRGGLNPALRLQAMRDLAEHAKTWIDIAIQLGVVQTLKPQPAQTHAHLHLNKIDVDMQQVLIQAVQSGDTSALEALARGEAPKGTVDPPTPEVK
ncbi:MAG: hypothetical protein UY48_C0003G0021 [Candidatus Gottesmanbacteria bacterium GW2011_GWB1_49_7]|uniref:Uncharacterized protein n=1 Tax=Candidatus Gottesmanbacteria bacterium GW2011_GWB1_49_7 TaxID=1618448 RepID=A0A0G1Z356_9BACT|nr:MAG: hypothetical protein UY48_C0003G0021 [Candidatus Gottesmanbacteria bacterium GW2011_GWB1_49_7]